MDLDNNIEIVLYEARFTIKSLITNNRLSHKICRLATDERAIKMCKL